MSPQIEASLGFSQEEWLEDPIRWYQQVHPDDKERWSIEAAEMFLSGKELRSSYRVLARDGRVVWFHCQAKMIRRDDGRPWFIHGIAFDITDLKRAEEALQEERNVASAILKTVGALVVVSILREKSFASIVPANRFPDTPKKRRGRNTFGICAWSRKKRIDSSCSSSNCERAIRSSLVAKNTKRVG